MGVSPVGGEGTEQLQEILWKTRNYDLNRSELVQKVLRMHTSSAAATVNFLERPRKYTEDDSLYMREVHFVMEVGGMRTPTMGEVAQRLNVTQGAVTQMATRLEKKGYVIRSKDTRDRRMTTISLTEKGQILREEHIEYDKEEFDTVSKLLIEFSEEELVKLIEYERIMCEIFTNHI